MAAKRELSSTLMNLKFMQRSIQRQEVKQPEAMEEEEEEQRPVPEVSFGGAPPAANRRCIIIMEGNPHPGAIKGRMSFQSFNPSIDKLNEEASNIGQPETCVDHQNSSSFRGNGVSGIRSEDSNVASPESGSDTDLKRKQPEVETETPPPQKLHKNLTGGNGGQSSMQNKRKGFHNKQKREKLNWNVLRPPKPQLERRGGAL